MDNAIDPSNTFAQIYACPSGREMDAIRLAHAFCASYNELGELCACLRLLDRLHGKAGGYFCGYLEGHWFEGFTGFGVADGVIEAYRDEAYAFLESISV